MWVGMGKKRNARRILLGNTFGKSHLAKSRRSWEVNINKDVTEVASKDVRWMKVLIFQVCEGCCLVGCCSVQSGFGSAYCFHRQGDDIALMLKVASISETSTNMCQNTRRKITEDSHLCGSIWVLLTTV